MQKNWNDTTKEQEEIDLLNLDQYIIGQNKAEIGYNAMNR